ncbi:hypothetical protein ONS95_012619 [Cadophora gregata]|uniref:uncharacterized protein n=1 Tax=Cadophora gregata TaxID=51156 RepID=UPI0026DB37D3|nr:uncharacterized protein ONS95_012619 [Cadophora gregata]KAK0118325.1 hypothetical protein ONS95_012619 [Cadophora gregata]KAK0123393.1 hypothetical protein ONS96_010384 [Cadophora gregata f. sp. sojae]
MLLSIPFNPKHPIMTTPSSKPPESSNSTSPTIPVPPTSATPSEVRTYFSTLLSTLHSAPAKNAEEIASKWKLGRGEEMLSFDIETYREIFGREAGTVLFRHVNRKDAKKGASTTVHSSQRERPKRDIFGLEPGCELIFFPL